ncbi:RNA polymerase sigma factor rpoD [Actinoplanes sp. SE50]|uniref:sigma-70 family RNA polymerase sigma factor n=1 Tax=unclassified Actinoplanes TaxID=2626549 RepID=UPI00023EBE4A|nr:MULTISPECIES: sigma-70 family RNA polymerase sigma factor [unclassified Actinoplanes]AEV81258.1 RNA polymerase sigma factor rpoD [Actinoplanes sp. SE50/110]ATO79661.1 RNA polymerase sigma factor rpoD [Actinoplanes sp. SE50]SLL97064.1 hypothetical protein ACSP50_0260 [Actinoplanes sp. SE50/110]
MPTTTGVTIEDDLDLIAEEYARLLATADQATDRRLRAEMIDRMVPFARRLAQRYRHSGEPFEDLVQVASLGLVKAVSRYLPERGSFTAYAVATISGELKRHFRDHTWSVRAPRRLQHLAAQTRVAEVELAHELGRAPTEGEVAQRCHIDSETLDEARTAASGYRAVSLSLPLGEGDGELADLLGSADPAFNQVADYLAVAKLARRLPPRVRRILILRFYQDRTQAQIAAEIGISQMHVSRVLTRALTWLREALLQDTVPPWPGNDADPMDGRVVSRLRPDGATEARICGEIDADSAVLLQETLMDTLRRLGGGALVLDLAGVSLLSAAGARVLRGVADAGRAHGVTVRLTGVRPTVRRVVAVAGLTRLLAPA